MKEREREIPRDREGETGREKERRGNRASRQRRAVAGRLTAPKKLVSCIWPRASQIIWGSCRAYLELRPLSLTPCVKGLGARARTCSSASPFRFLSFFLSDPQSRISFPPAAETAGRLYLCEREKLLRFRFPRPHKTATNDEREPRPVKTTATNTTRRFDV